MIVAQRTVAAPAIRATPAVALCQWQVLLLPPQPLAAALVDRQQPIRLRPWLPQRTLHQPPAITRQRRAPLPGPITNIRRGPARPAARSQPRERTAPDNRLIRFLPLTESILKVRIVQFWTASNKLEEIGPRVSANRILTQPRMFEATRKKRLNLRFARQWSYSPVRLASYTHIQAEPKRESVQITGTFRPGGNSVPNNNLNGWVEVE